MKITSIIGSNNKALNIAFDNTNILQSYETKICTVRGKDIHLHSEYKEYLKTNKHSNTTSKHFKLFCKLHGLEDMKLKDLK